MKTTFAKLGKMAIGLIKNVSPNRRSAMKRTMSVLGKMAVVVGILAAAVLAVVPMVSTQEAPVVRQKNTNYAPGTLIIKLKEGHTLDELEFLNQRYNVTSSARLFPDVPSPEERLEKVRQEYADFEAKEHESYYWQMDKESKEYKEYTERVEKDRQKFEERIKNMEAFVQHMQERKARAPKGAVAPKLDTVFILRMAETTDIPLMATDYKASGIVEYAHPDFYLQLMQTNSTFPIGDQFYTLGVNSNNKNYKQQLYLDAINFEEGLKKSNFGEGVVVAVIDTGVDYTNYDLNHNIWINTDETPDNNVDDDGNMIRDDYYGFDFQDSKDNDHDGYFISDVDDIDHDPMSEESIWCRGKCGHGTSCASIVAAEMNNPDVPGGGMVGIAPRAKIMALKMGTLGLELSHLAESLWYARNNGADVVSLSMGFPDEYRFVDLWEDTKNDAEAYIEALTSEGCVVVISAGNGGADQIGDWTEDLEKTEFPANLGDEIDGVLVVASFKSDDANSLATFSNYSDYVVVAPGNDVLVIDPYDAGGSTTNHTVVESGTSFSAPAVAGLAALLIKANPSYTYNAKEIAQFIQYSADDMCDSGRDDHCGYGRINVERAVDMAIEGIKCEITAPAYQQSITGKVMIIGNVYPVQAWTLQASGPLGGSISQGTTPVVNGVLGTWDVSGLTDGNYQLTLSMTSLQGNSYSFSQPVTVKNHYVVVEKKISGNGDQIYPKISGDKIIYEDRRTSADSQDIYMYDLANPTQGEVPILAKADYSESGADIDDDFIIWEEEPSAYVPHGRTRILWMAKINDLESKIALGGLAFDGYTHIFGPFLSGHDVAWSQYDGTGIDLYLFKTDDAASKNTPFINSAENELRYAPHLDQSNVPTDITFIGTVDNIDYIVYGVIATGGHIVYQKTSGGDRAPVVSKGRVYWRDDNDLYMYDSSTEKTMVLVQGTAVSRPDAYGDKVVWVDNRNGRNDIYMYDVAKSREVRVTTNAASVALEASDLSASFMDAPDIYENRVVWTDTRNQSTSGVDIYFGEVYFSPQIDSVSSTEVSPGEIITITGKDLGLTHDTSKVFFGTLEATVTQWSDTSITCVVPNITASCNLKVNTPGGDSNTVALTLRSVDSPTNLTVVDGGSSNQTVTLTWSNTVSAKDGFKIERSGDGVSFVEIGSVGAGTATFVDPVNADAGKELLYTALQHYYYRVRAYRLNMVSGYSNTADVKLTIPKPPTNLSATTVSESRIDLAWTDNSHTPLNEIDFYIERSSDGVNFTTINTVSSDVTSYSDTTVRPATLYYYRVRANGTSDPSNVDSAFSKMNPVITAPVLDSVINGSNTPYDITLRWQRNTEDIVGYYIEESYTEIIRADGSEDWTGFQVIGAVAQPKNPDVFPESPVTFTTGGKSTSISYKYRVRAFNGVNYSGYSNEVLNAATDTSPTHANTHAALCVANAPTDPHFLEVNFYLLENNSVCTACSSAAFQRCELVDWRAGDYPIFTLSQSAGRDPDTGETIWNEIGTYNIYDISHDITGLDPASHYTFGATACCDTLFNEEQGVSVTGTTSGAPVSPSQPVVVSASSEGVSFSWDEESDVVTGYTIERSIDGGSTWETIYDLEACLQGCGNDNSCIAACEASQIASFDPTTLTYTDATATAPGTTYTYRVSAQNDDGTSAPSAPVSVTSTQYWPPKTLSIAPATGDETEGVGQIFTTTFSDSDGYADITQASLKIADSNQNLIVYYNKSNDTFYLSCSDGSGGSVVRPTTGTKTITGNFATLSVQKGYYGYSDANTLQVKFNLAFTSKFLGEKTMSLYAQDSHGQTDGWDAVRQLFINSVPVLPNIGTQPDVTTGAWQTYTTTITDANGASDIAEVRLLVSKTSTEKTKALYARLIQANGAFTFGLSSDGGTTWSSTLNNTYVELDTSSAPVIDPADPTHLTITWKVKFKDALLEAALRDDYNIYLGVSDTPGAAITYTKIGSQVINSANNLAPVASSLTYSGTITLGVANGFAAKYIDLNEFTDIKDAYLKIVDVATPSKFVIMRYTQADDMLSINADTNTEAENVDNVAWQKTLPIGTDASYPKLFNQYAKLNCETTTKATSAPDDSLTITWQVNLTSDFGNGNKDVYLLARDNQNASSGWVKLKTITGINIPPEAASINPTGGILHTNTPQIFTTVYKDVDGAANIDINKAYFRIADANTDPGTNTARKNCFYAYYGKATDKLNLSNDDGNAWLKPAGGASNGCTAGSNAVLENSYFKLDCSQSSVTKSADNDTLTVQWAVIPKEKNITEGKTALAAQMYVIDLSNVGSAWEFAGNWTLNATPTLPLDVVATPVADGWVEFTATYKDLSGASDLSNVFLVVNTSPSDMNGLYAWYNKPGNKLYMYKYPSGVKTQTGAIAPGATNAGQDILISNAYAQLNATKTQVTPVDANTIQVKWVVKFTTSFTGAKNVYLGAKDAQNADSGLVQKGTWTIQ